MAQAEQELTDLELPDHLRHQQWEWRLQRFAWILGGLILVSACLGMFGRGPLVDTTATSPDDSLSVEYYWIERYESDAELRIIVGPSDDKTVQLALSRSFLDATTPAGVWPPPIATETQDEKLLFTFQLGDSLDEREIVYRYRHETYGPLTYSIGLQEHAPVELSQFIFP